MPTSMVDFAKQSSMNYSYGADVGNGFGSEVGADVGFAVGLVGRHEALLGSSVLSMGRTGYLLDRHRSVGVLIILTRYIAEVGINSNTSRKSYTSV